MDGVHQKEAAHVGGIRERGPDYLSVAAARKRATDVYTELRYAKTDTPVSADETPAEETPAGWTLGQVCVGYQGFLAHDRWINDRTKPPSEATNDDVRRAFGQASYQYLGIAPVLQLDRVQLNAARDGSRLTVSARKCTEYVKAAISWAAAEHPDESGLTEKMSPWWENVNAGKPDPTAMQEIEQRRKTHRQAKANLDVDAVAATLIAHEKYCSLTRNTAQRTSAYRASPQLLPGSGGSLVGGVHRQASSVYRRTAARQSEGAGRNSASQVRAAPSGRPRR
ncbi:hypothetical protein ACTGJ9_018515 [Bradyrhizobium sp. RDM12]